MSLNQIDNEIWEHITSNSDTIYCRWSTLPDFNLEFISNNVAKVLGYRHDLIESGAISFLSLIHEDDLFEFQIELSQASDDTTLDIIKHHPFRVKDANGGVLWMQQITTVKRSEEGRPFSYLGALSIANEIISLKERLDSATKRMKLAMQTSGIGTWELDVKSGAVVSDSSWSLLLGFTRNLPTISLMRLFAMINPDDIFEFKHQLELYLTGKVDNFDLVTRVRHIDGSWRFMLTKGVVTERDVENNPITFVASQTDITEQKKTELAAIEALSARNQFFARVSHEIRTPMHGILGILNLLKQEIDSPSALNQVTKVIENSEQLLFLLNDILDLAKLNETQLTITAELCSVIDIVDNVYSLFKDKASDKGLALSIVNKLDKQHFIIADKARLIQVLSNVVANSIKFTHKGYVSIELELSEENIILKVADSGVGIKDVDSIFNAYKQESSSNTVYGSGTGLGLEIVQRLCQLMNITITLESDESGTEFSFDLGKVKDSPKSLDSIDIPEAHEIELATFVGLKMLVVDDSDINREIAEQILLDRGATILSAVDGYQAVKEVAQNNDIDIILMDKHMPKMNGIEATEQIKAMFAGKQMPIVIALTADAFEVDNATWFKHGLTELLTKPFDAKALCSVIAKALSKRRQKG